MAAACVEAVAAFPRHHAAAQPTRRRTRVAMGTTDDYEETCCLGAGSYGAVVKGRHLSTGAAVAMKFLTSEPAGGGPEALLRESLFLEACVGNPFVVSSRGLARNPSTAELCLVMDCGGDSLRNALDQRDRAGKPPLPEAAVRVAMWQLLNGAKRMHDAHIIHRDIKPENILVGNDSVLRFCDFGLAVHMAEPPPYSQAGTLWYMAPEMLLEKTDYDALVDIWSLGCVMGELITGRAPFQGQDSEDQLCAIVGVLGVPEDRAWPWFSSTPFANQMTELQKQRFRTNMLRCKYPEKKLSDQGFELLNGLLTCNPDKRLTAAAALKHPWFSNMDVLDLPMVPPLPKRSRYA
jgi:cell division cycle 2-like protein